MCKLLQHFTMNCGGAHLVNFDVLFSEEGKLSWMYKNKVDDEEYLLGRRIDKSALNDPEPTTQSKLHYFKFSVKLLKIFMY